MEWDWDAVRGGGARSVGEGSMGAVSTGAAAVEAARSSCRHVRQTGVESIGIGVESTGQFSKRKEKPKEILRRRRRICVRT